MAPGPHDPTDDRHDDPAGESIGPLLTGTRLRQGRSQLRLAELLCAAAGAPTVTRHEISRWEREERIPSGYWLGWMSVVLDVPLAVLEAAAARARARRGRAPAPPGTANPPGAAVRPGAANPPGAAVRPEPTPAPPGAPTDPGAVDPAVLLAALRRMDDLVGGADLAATALRWLHAVHDAAAHRTGPGPGPGPGTGTGTGGAGSLLPEYAQLTSWVLADGGRLPEAMRMARWCLRESPGPEGAALAAHALGCLAEATTESDPAGALRLARRAHARLVAAPPASTAPTVRALALHRLAYAAARAGLRADGDAALLAAERLAAPGRADAAPSWLYWLDELHLTVLAGRCYAALGRPRPARALLTEALGTGRLPPRARALAGAWLATARAACGDLDGACETAGYAWLAAVRSGSVRVVGPLRALDRALRRHRRHPAVARYLAVAGSAAPYLPGGRRDAGRGWRRCPARTGALASVP